MAVVKNYLPNLDKIRFVHRQTTFSKLSCWVDENVPILCKLCSSFIIQNGKLFVLLILLWFIQSFIKSQERPFLIKILKCLETFSFVFPSGIWLFEFWINYCHLYFFLEMCPVVNHDFIYLHSIYDASHQMKSDK